MKKFDIRKFLTENKLTDTSKRLDEVSYKIYHKSTTDALETVKKFVEKKGYELDEEEWYRKVAQGGASGRARPSVGKSNRFSVDLRNNGKPTRKQVHFQIYGMENGMYELNMYLS